MVTVLHGDDITSSRNKLAVLKKQFAAYELFILRSENTQLSDILQIFEAQSLFSQKKLIILEGFIAAKDKVLVASILNHLKKNPEHQVIFWEAREIKKEILALFPKQTVVFLFKSEQMLFQFLEALGPKNGKRLLVLFHQLLKKESEDLVFYMLVRQFRLLLAVSSQASISEVKRLAPWQKDRLNRQMRLFTKEQLRNVYQKLFQIEKDAKTGGSALPLTSSLDLFLLDL